MNFNHDIGLVEGTLTIDTTLAPPLGGNVQSLYILGSGAIRLPLGATGARPTGEAGLIRFNETTSLVEFHNGTTWNDFSVGGSGITSITIAGSTGLGVSGSPLTTAGTITLTLDAGLQALSSLSGTGIVVQTAADTYATRSIAGTAGNISVADGGGVGANPTINLASVSQAASGNFVKVTLDGFGRVTGNTAVVASDITALVNASYVNVTGDTMSSAANLTFTGGGEVLGLPAVPSSNTAAASKAYVDSITSGLSWKQAVIAATTADITLANEQTVDGVALVAGDRVLVKDQTDDSENGIYIVVDGGAWIRAVNMDTAAEFSGATVFVLNGTLNDNTGWTQTEVITTVDTDAVSWVQFSGTGTYQAGTGLTLTGNEFSITSPIATTLGGTGTATAPSAGEILIGTGAGAYVPASVTAGTAIGITAVSGSLTINNTGVTELAGTANQITASGSTGSITLSLPSALSLPGTLTISGLTGNSFLYSATGGLVTSSTAATNGQILIGSTGAAPVKSTISSGTGISVTNGAGTITIANTGVTSVAASGGTTGLTFSGSPVTTTGTLTLGGTLAVSNGGTGITALGTANQVLGVNAGASAAEYKTISAGTGTTVVHGVGSITINNTGVTSVALSLPSFITVSGSPVTTTGTLTGTLATQSANSVFAGPASGGAAEPTFRSLVAGDISGALVLFRENPSTPTTPSATGANAVAIGSGSSATAVQGYAQGNSSVARLYGMRAYANGSTNNPGDAQHGVYVLRTVTTNATYTPAFLDGAGGSQRFVLPNNAVFTFDILVAGRRTDATGGGAGYRFAGVARKDATNGSMTFVGTPAKSILGETNTAWDARISADTTNGAILIEVLGETSKTVSWTAVVQTAEVTN